MRTPAIAFVTLAACGASPHPTAPISSTAPPAPPEAAGTSRFESVSWNDPVEHTRAQYPTLQEGTEIKQPFEGLPATVSFDFSGSVVHAIHVGIDGSYPGMAACLEAWKPLRAKLDAKWGASQSENGAAYWTTATSSVTASCNPDESGAAALSVDFTPPANDRPSEIDP